MPSVRCTLSVIITLCNRYLQQVSRAGHIVYLAARTQVLTFNITICGVRNKASPSEWLKLLRSEWLKICQTNCLTPNLCCILATNPMVKISFWSNQIWFCLAEFGTSQSENLFQTVGMSFT